MKKKIIALFVVIFSITAVIIGFAQNSPQSWTNLTETNPTPENAQSNDGDMKTTAVTGGNLTAPTEIWQGLATSESNSPSSNLPVHVVMDEVVFHVGFVSKKIDENSARGLKTDSLRGFYKSRAKFTEQDDVIFKKEMKEAAKTLEKIDEKIKVIIDTYRAEVGQGLAPGQLLPVVPAELNILGKEREKYLTELPQVLESKMGAVAYQKLKIFIEQEIAPKIRPIMGTDTSAAGAQSPSSPF